MHKKMKIGYARVSTTDQNLDSQIDQLEAWGCEKIYTDKLSGKSLKREGFERMMEMLRAGDELYICKLDRIGRSIKDLIEIVETFKEMEITLKVPTQGIETETPQGKLFFNMMASFAEYERELIAERIREGLKAARARGRMGGREPLLDGKQAKRLVALYNEKKFSIKELCSMFGIKRRTLYLYISKAK